MNYKKWVIVAITLFGIGILLGLVTPSIVASAFLRDIIANLGRLGGGLAQSSLLTIIFIFLKNVVAVLASFIFRPLL